VAILIEDSNPLRVKLLRLWDYWHVWLSRDWSCTNL